jgi:hypothetical protein
VGESGANRRKIGSDARAAHVYTSDMRIRTQVLLSPEQYAFLLAESARTGLSRAELMRRALDDVYRPDEQRALGGWEVSVGFWPRPDAALAGRRRRWPRLFGRNRNGARG